MGATGPGDEKEKEEKNEIKEELVYRKNQKNRMCLNCLLSKRFLEYLDQIGGTN